MAHLDGANVGDTVTVTIEINPTKAEAYRAGTMEMSATVA